MKRLGVFVLVLVCFGFACGAPSISGVSGEFDDGGDVVIVGSGFGSRTDGVTNLWEDFEDGVAGDRLDSTGYWMVDSNNPVGSQPQFSTQNNRHSHSSLTGEFTLTGPQDIAYTPDLNLKSNYIYIDLWMRFRWGALDKKHQIKGFKIQSLVNNNGGSDRDAFPVLNFYFWKYDGGNSWCYIPLDNWKGTNEDGFVNAVYNPTVPCPTEYKWSHYQVQLKNSDPDVANGGYKIYRDGSLLAEIDDVVIRLAGDNNFRSLWIGRYLGNDVVDLTSVLYYDDIYIDDSWARVEIGDSPSYDSCTKREIQMVNSWSGGSIGVSINQGSFAVGDRAYLFVIDSEGGVSVGHPIVLGTDSEIDCDGDSDGDYYGTGSGCLGVDCDDSDASVHALVSCVDYSDCSSSQVCGVCGSVPTEVCRNSLDDDCDGVVDENCEGGEGGEDGGVVGYEVVVDNLDSSVSQSGSGWERSSYYSGYYGEDYHYSYDESGSFEWVAELDYIGNYSVWAWWSSVDGRPENASYEVFYDGGSDLTVVSQEENGGSWQYLGEYSFSDSGRVVLTSGDSVQGVCADAVRFVLTSEDGVGIKGDSDGDGIVSLTELEEFVLSWVEGGVSIEDVLEVVSSWKE